MIQDYMKSPQLSGHPECSTNLPWISSDAGCRVGTLFPQWEYGIPVGTVVYWWNGIPSISIR